MGVFIELNLTESLKQLLHVDQEQRKKSAQVTDSIKEQFPPKWK